MKRGGGRAYRSRLESFADFIREQRQQRKSWQEIATQLNTEKNCAITLQGLHQFYRRHLKRQASCHWENEAAVVQPVAEQPTVFVRKTIVAATPVARSFRQPNIHEIKLNDPTNITS